MTDSPDPTSTAATYLSAALDAIAFGHDPEMADTAARVAQFWGEFRPSPVPPVQPLETQSTSPVIVRDLPFHSLCAHHMLPFFGTCTIAYQPAGAIAGLGWFPRLVDNLSRRPQLQERLVEQIAAELQAALHPQGVAVCVTARQMCVEMRGLRSAGTFEVTATAGPEGHALLPLVRPR